MSMTGNYNQLLRTGRSGYVIAGLLLEYGADVNAQDSQNDTPLLLADRNQQHAGTRLFLKKGVDAEVVDKLGNTPLLSAVLQNNETTTELLLESGVNFETPNDRLKQQFNYSYLGCRHRLPQRRGGDAIGACAVPLAPEDRGNGNRTR
ncbi:ankyrin repeat-containing domain protein [Biscogniauxia mediterranea]|nr:ankyrin repeat-containing domain protein [Biscogniauxia mediterranea]